MKAWAEKRRRELEASGETELARMFETVVKMCEADDSLVPSSKSVTISADSLDTSKPI
ncbi:MAG: hypothetical protein ACLQPD_26380 [Desulfomonilaceae bacterium]